MKNSLTVSSSFRDPSGYIFYYEGELYRRINNYYKVNYDLLNSSGLLKTLIEKKLLISHVEVNITELENEDTYKVIKPQYITFISYPFEWCFSQLKDAALLTLEIQKNAMEYGLTLKDASSYNVQFFEGKPIFIDTLSFEKYEEGMPWIAYLQFCKHFLAPLSLMAYNDVRLSQLLKSYLDGIPLDLCSKILPKRTKLNIHLFSHIHLHSKYQQRYSEEFKKIKTDKISKYSILSIIDSLETIIKNLSIYKKKSEWSCYYEHANYSADALKNKIELVDTFIEEINPRIVWDFGANTGKFSRIASNKNFFTVSFDNDIIAIEKNYEEIKAKKEKNILPLFFDITNPSPGIGWANEERYSLQNREKPDLIMALALIHHLTIGNNIPFRKIAEYFSRLGNYLIIEFVPKSDSQVQKLLINREDIFNNYNQENFETEFGNYFNIEVKKNILNSKRFVYKMSKKRLFL